MRNKLSHTVARNFCHCDVYGAPRGKRTTFHYQVKELGQMTTVFALTVLTQIAAQQMYAEIQFICKILDLSLVSFATLFMQEHSRSIS